MARPLVRLMLAAAVLPCLLLVCCSDEPRRTLCHRTSPYNSIYVTEEKDGLRVLRFELHGARQTVAKPGDPDHLELPYARAVMAGLAYVDQPQRVLVIGLGGGTIPTFLSRRFPAMTIDAVDIDPEVVAVAREFFDFKEDERMRAVVADGRKFVEEVREPYDVIILDAFGPDSIPRHLTTREFLQSVAQATRPDGVVISNVWSKTSNPLYPRMIRTYQDVFADLDVVDALGAGNKILLALREDRGMTRDEIMRRAADVTKRLKLRFDLAPLVAQGFEEPARGTNFEPLTDADSR